MYTGDAQTAMPLYVLDRVAESSYHFVFISPEMLLTEQQWRDMIVSPVYKDSLVAFVIDDAHFVKTW